MCVCVCVFARSPKRSRGKKLLTFQAHLLLGSKNWFIALRVNYQSFKVCLTFPTIQISHTIVSEGFIYEGEINK